MHKFQKMQIIKIINNIKIQIINKLKKIINKYKVVIKKEINNKVKII